MRKKGLAIFLALLLILQYAPYRLPLLAGQASAAEVPAGFTGIYTPEDLNQVRNNLSGSYVLMNDLDLSAAEWQPIGSKATPFKGVFDGNGHKIIGMNIHITAEEDTYGGLFGYLNKAKIKNLGMVDSTVKVENTSLNSSTSKAYGGAIAGYADNYSEITNSYNTGTVNAESLFNSYAGGLAGFARYSTIDGSYNTGDITAKCAGGIVGGVEYNPSKILNSYNTGAITGTDSAGGITGFFSGEEISNSSNQGNVTAYSNAGGIAAYGTSTVIKSSENSGNIKAQYDTGGIIGDFSSTSVVGSQNSGTITSTGTSLGYAGGIAGRISNGVITSSYNDGHIQSESYAGGINGSLSQSTIMKSYNSGTVEGSSNAGGIVSNNYSGSKLINTFNIGDITGGYRVGGLVGSNAGVIDSSYNIGPVKVTSKYYKSGGVAGDNTGTLQNSYYWDQQSNGAGSGDETGAVKKTAEELSSQASFAGFDFTSVWTMDGAEDYHLPKLADVPFSGIEKNFSIVLKSAPERTTYFSGEELDVTGGVITVITNFLNKTDVPVTQKMISGFDQNLVGSQTVTITYQGLTASFTVIVKDGTPPDKPEVREFTEKDTYLYGYAEAGSTVEAWKNESRLGGTVAGESGFFALYIGAQPAWTELTVTAKDRAGNVSEGTLVVVKDITAPSSPKVQDITDQTKSVTGTAEIDSSIDVMAGDSIIGTGTAGADGGFTVPIPVQKAGTELTITAKDKAGNVSTPVVVTVKDGTPPESPVVDEVTDQSTVVTGTAEVGSTVYVNFDQTRLGSAITKDDGTFTVQIPKQQAGKRLYVYAMDEAGNASDIATVLVKDATAPAKPVVHELTDHERTLTGKAEPLSTIIVKVSGNEIARKFFGYDEEFSIFLPVNLEAGTSVEVYAMDLAGNVSEAANTVVTSKLQSLAGETRYSTAVKVSQAGWETANTVLLINGFGIVDGLTATPLASAKDAPMLLTTADYLPAETLAELQRLQAKEVILIGGTSVISGKVDQTLRSSGYQVSRIGGKTRYETATLIAKELDKIVDVKTVFFAYGMGEPDALSIAAQAGKQKQPIILTDRNAIPSDTVNWLKTEQLENAYFVGGTQVISPSVISEVDKWTAKDVSNNRLSGSDRHETNAKVISHFYPESALSSILVAKSETASLVDALTAGPLAAKLGAPVLLVSKYGVQPSQNEVLAAKSSKHVHQIGGGIDPSIIQQIVR